MPAETAAHDCTWMAWPSSGYTLGGTAADAEEARATWAAVAHAVAQFEPVRMVVDPSATAVARDHLGSDVELLEAPLDDAWMRDIGPTFVLSTDPDPATGTRLGAVDWVFNGWGAQGWATWEKDARIARTIAEWSGAELISSPMVNEGGAIHVDGAGTVLATRTVQLDPGRNPEWTEERVEAELRRTLGVERVVWLERGLTRDYDEFGTRGHVDIVAVMPEPGVVLLHEQTDPAHPDHALREELRAAVPRPWRVVPVPAPRQLEDEHGPVDLSYINHYACNGGVVACGFDDPNDAPALDLLAAAYPGRRVVAVDARPLFARGGGIHCITQQQPALS
ncbi:agmatine deiminase family protein [Nocardioides nematodiphilus]|uniref:agmatine deiminase family protein n=1 Tax=Nocardioides nematodiphilus TaxID=2849669 RepID=UPI001CD96FB4|nr:agmatine deiminase family protein [Nocardioides nematodiphilus]MCA1984766.1 agmatine deiminase family protein [Nocardioides nematodiphilus]